MVSPGVTPSPVARRRRRRRVEVDPSAESSSLDSPLELSSFKSESTLPVFIASTEPGLRRPLPPRRRRRLRPPRSSESDPSPSTTAGFSTTSSF